MVTHFPAIPRSAREDENPTEQASWFLPLVIAVVALLLEIWLAHTYNKGNVGLKGFVLLHCIISAALAFYSLLVHRAGGDLRFPLLVMVTTAVMGPVGAAGCILSILLYALLYRHTATSFIEWFTAIFPEQSHKHSERLYEEILAHHRPDHRINVAPFHDIMALGSESQKREAISKMSRHYKPFFAPMLREASNDNSNMIRVQAATAISHIENAYLDHSLALEKALEANSRDKELLFAAAIHYDNYAFTGILDADREEYNRRRAYELYTRFLEREPSNIKARQNIGRLLVRSDDITTATDWLGKCLDDGYVSPEILLWYMECLYKQNKYSSLRYITSTYYDEIKNITSYPRHIVESIALWSNQEAVTEG